MTDTASVERRAGKRGARESHDPRLDATKFVQAGPTGYTDWDGSHGFTDVGIDGNAEWSNCGAAATDHGNMIKAGNLGLLNTLGQSKYNGTLPTYWAYGLSMGETGQPPNQPDQPDQGVDNKTWLGFLYTEGIIDGYGEVPLNQLDHFAPIGSGLLLALALDDDAEADFEAVPPIPWGSSNEVPDPNEGHDTWLVKLQADGGGALLTWGAQQEFDLYFRENNITDAWIIFDKDDPAVDWTALQAALDEVHGTRIAAADTSPALEEGEGVIDYVEHKAKEIVDDVESWWRRGSKDVSEAPIRPDDT